MELIYDRMSCDIFNITAHLRLLLNLFYRTETDFNIINCHQVLVIVKSALIQLILEGDLWARGGAEKLFASSNE